MRESVRLAYLEAMGVTGWVPTQALAHAAACAVPEPELEPEVVTPSVSPLVDSALVQEVIRAEVAPSTPLSPAHTSASPVVTERRHALPVVSTAKPGMSTSKVEPVAKAEPEVELPAVAPFYLQLWIAGPCALLIETSDPGLEKGTPEHNLLCDILRACDLPPAPRLYADFRWPLSRNPQVARSASAASEALQAFMQARLEQTPVKSIGCFGALAGLLAEPDPVLAKALYGREKALEELTASWFAPDLRQLMTEQGEKARLWQLLKRVMPRWQGRD